MPTSTELQNWTIRRRQLRKRLWDLLLDGKVPPPKQVKYKTTAKGAAAENIIEDNINRCIDAFPDIVEQHPRYFNFERPKHPAWETFIISYPSWPGEPAQSAILRVPKKSDRQAPAVLCFHGHARGCLIGKELSEHLAIKLASRGFVTLSPDATRFGDRRDTTFEKEEIRDWKGYYFHSERNFATALLLRGQTLLGVMTWEHMRAVDILKSMDFVDNRRIGTLGMSMGGMQSFWLTVMDSRITCGTEACGVSSFRIWAKKHTPNAMVCFVPHILKYTDTPEIGSLIAPRPFMCLDAANDVFFPITGIRELGRQMRKTYKLYDAADKFRHHIHTGGHYFTDKHTKLAINWLERWIGK